jgi:hypothetical protein
VEVVVDTGTTAPGVPVLGRETVPSLPETTGGVEHAVVDGVVIDAIVAGVVQAAPATPATLGTAMREATAIPDPMSIRLAHMLVALLSVEAPPLRSPFADPNEDRQPATPIMACRSSGSQRPSGPNIVPTTISDSVRA